MNYYPQKVKRVDLFKNVMLGTLIAYNTEMYIKVGPCDYNVVNIETGKLCIIANESVVDVYPNATINLFGKE
jgi:hypothetical protein